LIQRSAGSGLGGELLLMRIHLRREKLRSGAYEHEVTGLDSHPMLWPVSWVPWQDWQVVPISIKALHSSQVRGPRGNGSETLKSVQGSRKLISAIHQVMPRCRRRQVNFLEMPGLRLSQFVHRDGARSDRPHGRVLGRRWARATHQIQSHDSRQKPREVPPRRS